MTFINSPVEDYSLDSKWCVVNENANATCCVLMLAGRTQPQNLLPSIYWYAGVRDILIIGIATKSRAWYPLPKGEYDQRAALCGIPDSVDKIESAVRQIGKVWKIPKHRIALLGFSAGGVMSIQVAAHSKEPYAGVICQSGAILSPYTLPKCRSETPFMLTHSKDDEVFEWEERYLPMRKALVEKEYHLTLVENPYGGHSLTNVDIAMSKIFMRRCFREGRQLA